MARLFGYFPVVSSSGLDSPVVFADGVITILGAPVGESPIPDDDLQPAVSLLTFRFGAAVDDAAGNDAIFDPYERVNSIYFRGLVLFTDGFTRNKDWDGDRITNLEIEAPGTEPTAAAGGAAVGSTGDYKYRFRYLSSKTGKVSGASPIPETAVSVTDQEVDLSSITVSPDPQVDEIQVFRTLNDDFNSYYLLTTLANSGTPLYSDDISVNTDDVIINGERLDLVEGRQFNEGIMWPVLKSYHNVGFVYYFGLRRMPTIGIGTVEVTQDDREVTFSGAKIRHNRIGQRFKVQGDNQIYHILTVDDATETAKVEPAVERASASGLTYTIEDDRDGRILEISEAGWPGSVPTLHQFVVGADISDIMLDMFDLGGTTYIASQQHIFKVTGDKTVEPWNTLFVDIAENEGPCGPNAGAVIPGLGYVYIDEKLGPRVFDGSSSAYLGTEREETVILKEWARFKSAKKWYISVGYDETKSQILFSYSRDDDDGNSAIAVFSLATGEWLLPWTRRMFSYGELLDSDYSPRNVVGSDLGSLFQDRLGFRDGFDRGTLQGTVTSLSGRIVTDTGASLYTGGEGLYSALVEFRSETNLVSYAYIVGNTGTTFTVLGFADPEPQVGWTYKIAVIPWVVITGYIDGGSPHNRKEFDSLQLRYTQGRSGTIRAAVAVDGGQFFEAHSGEVDATGKIHARFKLDKGGLAFQVLVSGSGEADSPEITQAVVFLEGKKSQLTYDD